MFCVRIQHETFSNEKYSFNFIAARTHGTTFKYSSMMAQQDFKVSIMKLKNHYKKSLLSKTPKRNSSSNTIIRFKILNTSIMRSLMGGKSPYASGIQNIYYSNASRHLLWIDATCIIVKFDKIVKYNFTAMKRTLNEWNDKSLEIIS